MYAGGATHELRDPCRAILTAVAQGRLPAVTSAEVLQEIVHRYVAIKRPEIAAAMARSTLDLFGTVLSVTREVVSRVPGLVERYPALGARDLVHVATCIEYGVEAIITPDRAFDVVSELQRVDPSDVAAVARHLS
jgi:predicted nucleic acid-binding protein